MQDDGFTLDHRTLAALARDVEEGDPIAWGDTALDRDAPALIEVPLERGSESSPWPFLHPAPPAAGPRRS